jgi:hypothetical protein
MDAMTGWKRAIEAEDVEAVLRFYDPDYREEDGRTAESVGVALRSILWKYLEERVGSVANEWKAIYAWRYPVVRLLVREWRIVSADRVEVATKAVMWAGGGPELEPSDMFVFPWGRPNDMVMAWQKRREGWRILKTTPAFLRMEDTVIYRYVFQGW